MTRNQLMTGAAGLALALGVATAGDARELPALADLEGAGSDGYWEYYDVATDEQIDAFQAIVGAPAVPMENPPAEPLQIGFVYPSLDVSDFWLRNYIAMLARLDELGIPYETVQYASDIDEHTVQATYAEQMLQEDFDYVVFGPTELRIQQDGVKALLDKPDTEVMVWNYTVVPQEWGATQPLSFVAFSHLNGALNMCRYVLETLGNEGTLALIRGTPGSIDDQRSAGFADCVSTEGNWEIAYEHYGNFTREGGYTGAQQILQAFPEVTLIHNANTAMAMGALSAVQEISSDVLITGWGGTGDELEAMRLGELWATPMRMADDIGVAAAEAIRADLEGRADKVPLVFLGRITIATGTQGAEEVDAMEAESFRYSGIGTLER